MTLLLSFSHSHSIILTPGFKISFSNVLHHHNKNIYIYQKQSFPTWLRGLLGDSSFFSAIFNNQNPSTQPNLYQHDLTSLNSLGLTHPLNTGPQYNGTFIVFHTAAVNRTLPFLLFFYFAKRPCHIFNWGKWRLPAATEAKGRSLRWHYRAIIYTHMYTS